MKQVTEILYSGQSTREVPSTSHKSHIPPQFPDRCIKLTDGLQPQGFAWSEAEFYIPKTTRTQSMVYMREAMFFLPIKFFI